MNHTVYIIHTNFNLVPTYLVVNGVIKIVISEFEIKIVLY